MNDQLTVVAVDGPAASGKSTVSRLVAGQLGCHYVDSGAMYRAVTWQALEMGINVEDPVAVIGMLHAVKISFAIVDGEAQMSIDGVYPGAAIRAPRVAENVSAVAAIPEVRQILVQQQRALTRFGSLVMEGRDIGSVVFPDTPHKFYLDADPAVRVQRRQRDFQELHIAASPEGVAQSLQQRDQRDSARQASPLQIALGATVIDNSQMTAEETARVIVDHLRRQQVRRGSFTAGPQ